MGKSQRGPGGDPDTAKPLEDNAYPLNRRIASSRGNSRVSPVTTSPPPDSIPCSLFRSFQGLMSGAPLNTIYTTPNHVPPKILTVSPQMAMEVAQLAKPRPRYAQYIPEFGTTIKAGLFPRKSIVNSDIRVRRLKGQRFGGGRTFPKPSPPKPPRFAWFIVHATELDSNGSIAR